MSEKSFFKYFWNCLSALVKCLLLLVVETEISAFFVVPDFNFLKWLSAFCNVIILIFACLVAEIKNYYTLPKLFLLAIDCTGNLGNVTLH